MKKLKIPRSMKGRLKDVGQQSGFKNADDFGAHLVDRGLATYAGVERSMSFAEQVQYVVDNQGYSSPEELIEHLLERGLVAYSNEDNLNREQLEMRLRGLGYID